MHDYEGRVDFSGDPVKALENARNILGEKKLTCQPIGGGQLQFQGKVIYLEKGADPLTGISQATLIASGGVLTVQAEFGCLRGSFKFLAMFLGALTLPDYIILGVVFTVIVPSTSLLLLTLLISTLLPIVLLWLAYVVRKRRIATALGWLLHQIAQNAPR